MAQSITQTFLDGEEKIARNTDDVEETSRILMRCADICQGRDAVAFLKSHVVEIFGVRFVLYFTQHKIFSSFFKRQWLVPALLNNQFSIV